MPHPLTRAKALQNAAFLKRLEATGNVRLAAEKAGVFYRTMQRRRAAHPDFAQRWDAALAVAQARLGGVERSGGARGGRPSTTGPSGPAVPLPAERGGSRRHRTSGGESVVIRRRDGTLQVRRAHAGRLTRAAEQAFLAALSATCNVRLAAAAAGAQSTHFYKRRRENPGFAREWRLALEEGYRRIEAALIAGFLPEAHEDEEWRHNEPPEMPAMTPAQALQLMYLHQKEVAGYAEPGMIKRRPGEPREVHHERIRAMGEARLQREREKFRVAEAARAAGTWKPAGEGPLYTLPDLEQVRGWSRADTAKAMHDAARALFGGWRIEEMEERMRRGPSREQIP